MKLQKAVKQETIAVATGTGIGCLVLIALFLVLHLIFPESTPKFDYRVVLGALAGGGVAIANFFLMALTVQNVVNVESKDDALRIMRVSYRNRMLMRAVWIIVAIFAPCFNYAAGIIPLFIPSFVIKIRGIRMGLTGSSPARRPADAGGAVNTEAAAEPGSADGTDAAGAAETAGKPESGEAADGANGNDGTEAAGTAEAATEPGSADRTDAAGTAADGAKGADGIDSTDRS